MKKTFPARFKSASALLLLYALITFSGCQPDDAQKTLPDQQVKLPPKVIAVCYPLQYLTQRIAGNFLTVECPVPTGASGRDWRPNREAIFEMQSADLIVANGRGATYAKWLETISIPAAKLCNSATRGLSLSDYVAVEDIQVVHSHGPEGEHSHPTMIAHTWLDPAIAKKQSQYVAAELSRVFPEQTQSFHDNLTNLNSDLDQLSAALTKHDGVTPPPIVFSTNPNLKFLSRAAGLDDHHLHWLSAPDLNTAGEEIAKILNLGERQALLNQDGKMILLSTFPVDEPLIRLLAEKNLSSISIDLLDQQPATGDYLTVMQQNIERLNQAINTNSANPVATKKD